MQSEIAVKQVQLPDRMILEICSEFENASTQSIVKQAKELIQNGSKTLVLDLSKTNGVSFLGFTELIGRANNAGVLEKVEFNLPDPVTRRFFSNMKRIMFTLGVER